MCTVPELFLFSVCPVRASFEDLRARSTPLLRDIRYTENPRYLYVPSFIEKYANSLGILQQSFKEAATEQKLDQKFVHLEFYCPQV